MVWRQAGFIGQLNVVWYKKYDCIIQCGIAKITSAPSLLAGSADSDIRLRKHCQLFLYSLILLSLSTACNALAYEKSGKINIAFFFFFKQFCPFSF